MATRRKFSVIVNNQEQIKYAWNSAITAGEAMVREIARSEQQMYSGGTPLVTRGKPGQQGAVYSRVWTGDINGNKLLLSVVAL